MWIIFFLVILLTKYVILILYVIQPVGSWGMPGGIGALFVTLSHNYDLALMSHYTFTLDITGRSYGNKLTS